MQIFTRLILIGLGVSVSIFTYHIFSLSFEEVKHIVSPDKIYKTIFGEELEGTRFNDDRFTILRQGVLFLYVFSLLILFFLFLKTPVVLKKAQIFFNFISEKRKEYGLVIKKLTTVQKISLVFFSLAILAFKTVLIFVIEGDNDELRSYEYFVNQGFWISLTYYPDTNNHIFYNLICIPFDKILNDGLLVMRVPALLANLLLLFFIFVICLKRFGFTSAVLTLALSSFVYEAAYFGVIGRGHLWMCLFAFISLFAFLKYLDESKKYFLLATVLFSILGLFTVPTYLFFLGSMYVYGLAVALSGKKNHLLVPLMISGICIVGGTIICYLPIILVNGWDVLINHRWVQALTLQNFFSTLPVYLKELPEYLLGLHGHISRSYLIAAVLGVVFGVVYFKSDRREVERRRWMELLLIFFIVPVVMIMVLRFFPPYRVFTYYIFMLHIGIGILLNYLLIKLSKSKQHVFVGLFFLLFFWVGVESFLI